MPKEEAAELFARLNLDAQLFPRVWAATGAGDDAALSQLQFCVFVHLARCAAKGRPPPEGLTPAQAERLVDGSSGGFAAALPAAGGIYMDASRVRSTAASATSHADCSSLNDTQVSNDDEEEGAGDVAEGRHRQPRPSRW